MKRQTITIEVTVPDHDSDPDQMIIAILEENMPGQDAEPGYGWWMTDSSKVTTTHRHPGPVAWHWAKIRLDGRPVETPTEMRAALTAVGREWDACTEAGNEGEEWWTVSLKTDDPMIGMTTTGQTPDGRLAEVEIPEV